jgi:hypothetical protein
MIVVWLCTQEALLLQMENEMEDEVKEFEFRSNLYFLSNMNLWWSSL